MNNEATTDARRVYITAYHWQLVSTMAFCAPWRWHIRASACRIYVFKSHWRL